MKKPKFNPDYPTVPILIFGVIMGLGAVAMGIYAVSIVREALATGRTYSVGIILDDTTMIYRSDSPQEYWAMIGFYIIGVVAMIPLGIFVPINVTKDYIKKLSRQKKEHGMRQP